MSLTSFLDNLETIAKEGRYLAACDDAIKEYENKREKTKETLTLIAKLKEQRRTIKAESEKYSFLESWAFNAGYALSHPVFEMKSFYDTER